jgi:hypothetical protein
MHVTFRPADELVEETEVGGQELFDNLNEESDTETAEEEERSHEKHIEFLNREEENHTRLGLWCYS